MHRRRDRSTGRVVALTLGLVGLCVDVGQARAQDVAPVASESAASLFERVVGEARRTGAIERVLGLHTLMMTRHFYDDEGVEQGHRRFLMTYDISIDEVAEELRLVVLVLPEKSTGRVDISYVVGLDGRLRSARSNAGGKLEARVDDGRLILSTANQQDAIEHAWSDEILPKLVSAFVMPMLFDQGLPEVWSFRDLNPFGDLTQPIVQRPLAASSETVRIVGTFEGRPRETTRVHVALGGEQHGLLMRIETESEVDSEGRVTHLAVSERLAPEEYERLRPTWQPAPPPEEGR